MLSGRIFITGGSGTLGRAIMRIALAEKWDCEFTAYARSESKLANLKSLFPKTKTIIGDVRDYDRLSAAVIGHDIVIHAAALKRIPECEQHPTECIATNVVGSQNVIRACIAGEVKRCIGISTDKSCRAITCYGASKLCMEKLFQAQADGPCIFTLVRYGNVVASNGSVIPLWRQQAKEGKAISVTRMDATRFWMGESDAVKLIERAGSAIIPNNVILVPKMRSLSLAELAHIIAPGAELIETGFRSVEKLHEDLISSDEAAWCVGDDHFIIAAHGDSPDRLSYTSYDAPRLTPQAFRAMLAEAESHE